MDFIRKRLQEANRKVRKVMAKKATPPTQNTAYKNKTNKLKESHSEANERDMLLDVC